MKCFFTLLLCFILCSCAGGSATHEAIDAVNASLDALEQSLPKECKTKAIDSQFVAIRKETAAIKKDYDAEISKANSERVKWKTAFFALAVVIAAFVGRKVFRLI